MPSVKRCDYCNKAESDLRRCAGCRLVQYCSKNCQRIAWKTHKERCELAKESAHNPDMEDFNKALSKWISKNKDAIHGCALHAFDLANHPPDRLATHIVYVEVKRRVDSSNPAHCFQVTKGVLLSVNEFCRGVRESQPVNADRILQPYQNKDKATPQIVIHCPGAHVFRTVWFTLLEKGLRVFREVPSAEAAFFAAHWDQILIQRTNQDSSAPISTFIL